MKGSWSKTGERSKDELSSWSETHYAPPRQIYVQLRYRFHF